MFFVAVLVILVLVVVVGVVVLGLVNCCGVGDVNGVVVSSDAVVGLVVSMQLVQLRFWWCYWRS